MKKLTLKSFFGSILIDQLTVFGTIISITYFTRISFGLDNNESIYFALGLSPHLLIGYLFYTYSAPFNSRGLLSRIFLPFAGVIVFFYFWVIVKFGNSSQIKFATYVYVIEIFVYALVVRFDIFLYGLKRRGNKVGSFVSGLAVDKIISKNSDEGVDGWESTKDQSDDVDKDSSGIEMVIDSLNKTMHEFKDGAKTSLLAITIIVIAGIMASYGVDLFNKYENIRQLNARASEVGRLLKQVDIKGVIDKDSVARIVNEYAQFHKSYAETLLHIEEQSKTSWPDIAMRITIAALTLFLVQVFFHIYKYNKMREAAMQSKLDVLILFDDPKADLNTLRTELLAKLGSDPRFDRSPPTMIDQAANALRSRQ